MNISIEEKIHAVMDKRFRNMNGHTIDVFSVDLESFPKSHSLWRIKKEIEPYLNLTIFYRVFISSTGEEVAEVKAENSQW